jgi:hypothetical protein
MGRGREPAPRVVIASTASHETPAACLPLRGFRFLGLYGFRARSGSSKTSATTAFADPRKPLPAPREQLNPGPVQEFPPLPDKIDDLTDKSQPVLACHDVCELVICPQGQNCKPRCKTECDLK